jgi:glyoxalase superfamily protein
MVGYTLVIDCHDPELLARFWAEALHYVLAPPPAGFASWDDFLRSMGVPEDELGHGPDRIEDPNGEGPRIWFQVVPDEKAVKNRLHLDLHASREGGPIGVGGTPETMRARVEAEAERLVALGATRVRALTEEGSDLYAVGMTDPEGNEFDIN